MSTALTWLPYGVCGAENPVRLDAEGLELVVEARLWSLCAPPLPLIGLTAVGLFATHTNVRWPGLGRLLRLLFGRPPTCQVKLATGGITTIGRRLLTRLAAMLACNRRERARDADQIPRQRGLHRPALTPHR